VHVLLDLQLANEPVKSPECVAGTGDGADHVRSLQLVHEVGDRPEQVVDPVVRAYGSEVADHDGFVAGDRRLPR
jgi:hypothetical protein